MRPRSLSRQRPRALKFSRASPERVHPGVAGGAQRVWLRCSVQRFRAGSASRPATALRGLLQRAGCPAAAAAGGVPRMLSRMNRPRFTGEVRSGFDVTTRTVPCVSTPPRGLSGGQVDPAHLVALDALDPVVLRQPLVEERVVAVDQLQQAPVLADDVLEEHLRLAPHGPAEVAGQLELAEAAEPPAERLAGRLQFLLLGLGEFCRWLADQLRNRARRRSASGSGGSSREITARALIEHGLDVARLEPLADEVPDELRRARVGEHPLDLGRRGSPRSLCSPARRISSSSGIDDQRKYDSREARAYSSTTDEPGPAARLGRLLAEQEPRRRQDGRHRLGDAASKVCPSWDADGLGQRRQPVHRRVVHGAAEGPRRRTVPGARARSARRPSASPGTSSGKKRS